MMVVKALSAALCIAAATAAPAAVAVLQPTVATKIAPPVDGLAFTTPPAATTHVVAPTVVSSVPEPAAWALMIAGFGVVGLVRRSRRRPIAA